MLAIVNEKGKQRKSKTENAPHRPSHMFRGLQFLPHATFFRWHRILFRRTKKLKCAYHRFVFICVLCIHFLSMSILGAILRPGLGNPAFQIVCIYAGCQSSEISLASKTRYATINSGAWSIKPVSPFTTEEWPSRVPDWLAVSQYAIVCNENPDASYRIFSFRQKPRMPPRCYDMEIQIPVFNTNARSAHIAAGNACGRQYMEHIRAGGGIGWYSISALQNRVQPAASVSPQHRQQYRVTHTVTINGVMQSSELEIIDRTSRIEAETQRLLHLNNLYTAATTARERAQQLTNQSRTAFTALPQPKPLCTNVAKILVENARSKGEECPITFDSLCDITQFCVPVCGHVCSDSAAQLTRCPVCREPTSWTRVEIPA